MKFKNISIYALTMAAGMGLWSCTSDEALSGGEAYGEPIPVTITLSRGDAQTRTELSENAEGGLDDKWLRNDQLVVINSNNEEVGVLKFVKYVDDLKPNEAVFQGTLEGVADGVYDYTLWYLGGNGTQQAPLSEFINDRTVDGSKPMLVKTTLTRQTGKLDDLVRGDLLSKQIKIRVSDHKAAVEQSLDAASRTMTAHLAMASIKLEGVGGVTDGTLKISHAPSNIDPVYKVYFNRYSTSKEASVGAKENPLIIDRVNTSDPVYMVLCPSQYSGNTALVLTLTSGDKTWTATLPDITMEAGKYYRNGADGKQFSVTMTEEQKSELHIYANFTGANPEKVIISKPFVDGSATYDLSKPYGDESYTGDNGDKLPDAPAGYTFLGWSTSSEATTPDCNEITTYNNQYGRIGTVYAVWSFVDDSDNPGNMNNWGSSERIYETAVKTSLQFSKYGRYTNCLDLRGYGGWGTWVRYSNGIMNNLLTSNNGTAFYFQWGRLMGFPSNVKNEPNMYYAENTPLSFGEAGYTGSYKSHYEFEYTNFSNADSNKYPYVFSRSQSFSSSLDWNGSNPEQGSWETITGNICPAGYRLPSASELSVFVPSDERVYGSKVEYKNLKGIRYAIEWVVTEANGNTPSYITIRMAKTNRTDVEVNDDLFKDSRFIRLVTYGFINQSGTLVNRGSNAIIWSNDTGENKGTIITNTSGYGGKALYVETKGTTAALLIVTIPRVIGGNVIPFKDKNSSKSVTYEPWFPYADFWPK